MPPGKELHHKPPLAEGGETTRKKTRVVKKKKHKDTEGWLPKCPNDKGERPKHGPARKPQKCPLASALDAGEHTCTCCSKCFGNCMMES